MAISVSGNLVFLDFTRRELSYVIKKKKEKKIDYKLGVL